MPEAPLAPDDGPQAAPRSRWRWAAGVGAAVLVLVAVLVLAPRGDEHGLAAPPATTTTTTTAVPEATTTTVSPFPQCTPVPPGTGPPGPLTGTPVEAPGVEQRPALIVKIDNYDPGARPQAGLTRADVVYEEKVEGPLSRFAAVFQSTTSTVGPVRSARSTDILIATPLNRPLFAYSGANGSFQAQVSRAPLIDVGAGARGGAYYRGGGHAAPHNLFADAAALWSGIPAGPPPALWPFRAAGTPPPAGQPVTQASYHFGGGVTAIRWVWEPESGTFARWQNGTPHIDTDWCQVKVENVVVQLVDYVDSGVKDSAGGAIPEAALVGTGQAWVLSGGQAVEATWTRDTVEVVTTYTGPDGQPIAMAPGRTWVALVPKSVGLQLG